jgi:hypothetical protein
LASRQPDRQGSNHKGVRHDIDALIADQNGTSPQRAFLTQLAQNQQSTLTLNVTHFSAAVGVATGVRKAICRLVQLIRRCDRRYRFALGASPLQDQFCPSFRSPDPVYCAD